MISQSCSKIERESVTLGLNDLRVWEKSFELALAVFKIADQIPQDTGPGLTAEMRVVALSVPSHIARGHSRATSREFLRGLYQARGALAVLKARLAYCGALGFATDIEIRRADVQHREVCRMVDSLIADLRADGGVGGLGTPSRGIRSLRPRGPLPAAAGR